MAYLRLVLKAIFLALYVDVEDVTTLDLSDSIYILGTLKVHHAKRINKKIVDFTSIGKLKNFLLAFILFD